MKCAVIALLVLSSPAAAEYDYYDNADYWGEELNTFAAHPSRVLDIDSNGSYSFGEFYGMMKRIGLQDCEDKAREDFHKLAIQTGFAAPMCAAFGRASKALGGVCAGYVGVRGYFEKRAIAVRERRCNNDINERWHRGDRVE